MSAPTDRNLVMNPQPPPFPFRVGIGYDVHRLVSGRRLVLGGVEIAHPLGLDGHSDADVLLHALCDALLGAAGLGDIGEQFPPGDPKWRDADSLHLLGLVVEKVRASGFEPVNCDLALLAEAPRLAPYREAIRGRIARALAIPSDRIGVKATTNEGLGAVGRGEGMAAMAVVLIRVAEP